MCVFLFFIARVLFASYKNYLSLNIAIPLAMLFDLVSIIYCNVCEEYKEINVQIFLSLYERRISITLPI